MDTRMEAMLQGGPFKKLLEEQIAELRQKYDMKKAELEILYFLLEFNHIHLITIHL